MAVSDNAQELINAILAGRHSDEEWLSLEQTVHQFLCSASIADKAAFAESGAGEALYMVCSGLSASTHQK